MKTILFVGLGGGIGSIIRYLLSQLIQKSFPNSFPWGTFTVNVLGAFIAGIFLTIIGKNENPESMWKYLLITGFCGGFTTFSAFASENILLIQQGNTNLAILYIFLSIVIGLLFIWLGIMTGKLC